MRFPADDLHDIRRGEKTLVHLPHTGGPCRFREGRIYKLQRVMDVPELLEHTECAGVGCESCDEGRVTVYRRVSRPLEGEYVLVAAKPRRQRVEGVTDADALREGFESVDEWRDVFECDHGDYAEVWRIEFTYTTDVPHLLAKHGDYTQTDFDALPDEPEAVDPATLDQFVREAHNRDERRDEQQREERKLSEWLAELEDDPTTSAHQLASVRKRLEQIDKRRQRKAA
jgi:hypothetical protein